MNFKNSHKFGVKVFSTFVSMMNRSQKLLSADADTALTREVKVSTVRQALALVRGFLTVFIKNIRPAQRVTSVPVREAVRRMGVKSIKSLEGLL
jgi:hypothetical protein